MASIAPKGSSSSISLGSAARALARPIDAINRTVLQDELINIHQKSRKTFLFVTHDILEALKLGTRVMVMDKGSIRQFDTPSEILKNPADDYVKQLMDSFRQGFAFALERGMGPGEQR